MSKNQKTPAAGEPGLKGSTPERDFKKPKKFSIVLPVTITFLVAAVLCGGSVYLWYEREAHNFNSQKESLYDSYQKRITELKKQSQENKKELEEKSKKLTDQEANQVKLPVVTYERAGLLDTTEKGKLKTKLLDPFLDYHNEKEMTYIAVIVTVPENVGEQYSVTAVHKNGGNVGFLFGKRGEDFDFWKPDCMEECEYTDEFKEKYPEIVGQ